MNRGLRRVEQGLVEEVAQLLARSPGILRAMVGDQARETLDRRPGENAWSQTEILAHLAGFEVICFPPLRGDWYNPENLRTPARRAPPLTGC